MCSHMFINRVIFSKPEFWVPKWNPGRRVCFREIQSGEERWSNCRIIVIVAIFLTLISIEAYCGHHPWWN